MSVDRNSKAVNLLDFPRIFVPVARYVLMFRIANARIKKIRINPKYILSTEAG
jgi:hypothetical protein